METNITAIDKTDMFIINTYTCSYKLDASTGSTPGKEYTFSITIPDGYQIFSFSNFNTSVAGVTIGGVSPPKMRLINLGSAMSSNKTAYMTVVFIKKEYVGHPSLILQGVQPPSAGTLELVLSDAISWTIRLTYNGTVTTPTWISNQNVTITNVGMPSNKTVLYKVTMPATGPDVTLSASLE